MHPLFYICLFFAVWFGVVNAIRVAHKHNVPVGNMVIMSAAIVGCIYAAVELKMHT